VKSSHLVRKVKTKMALSLDDKLLGEKTHYYCSSSSEGEEDDDDIVKCASETNTSSNSVKPPRNVSAYSGRSTNVSRGTGQ